MTNIFDQPRSVNHDIYKKPIDPAIIKEDLRGNKYVKAYEVVKIADSAFNEAWSLSVDNCWSETIADYDIVFYAAVTVTVPGFGSRSAVGGFSFRDILRKRGNMKSISELSTEDVQPTRTSDLYKMAVTDGLKKAMSLFQICSEVYESEKDKMELNAENRQSYGEPSTPPAKIAAPVRLAALSNSNKAELKMLMKEYKFKTMTELSARLDSASIKVLNNETFDAFKTYLSLSSASSEKKAKDVPV